MASVTEQEPVDFDWRLLTIHSCGDFHHTGWCADLAVGGFAVSVTAEDTEVGICIQARASAEGAVLGEAEDLIHVRNVKPAAHGLYGPRDDSRDAQAIADCAAAQVTQVVRLARDAVARLADRYDLRPRAGAPRPDRDQR